MSIQYKKLGSEDIGDLISLIKVYEEVFEMQDFIPPATSYLQSLLEQNGIIFIVALSENFVVGGLTAYTLPSVYEAASELYIYDLGVSSKNQRQGIGRQLIAALNEHCAAVGFREVFVQADLEDNHAIEFYKATGGKQEQVVHFSYKIADAK